MIDPTRYVRKAVIDALRAADVAGYGQAPPSSAVTPYCLVSIGYEGLAQKNMNSYRVSTTIEIHHEFREDGGRKSMDEITDTIMDIFLPDNLAYLSIENFNHANCRVASSDERTSRDNSITEFIKVIRFESLINQS
jgi:hypothetical protein